MLDFRVGFTTMSYFLKTFVTGTIVAFSVSAASAATITFSGALGGNPNGTYTEGGYDFTPNSGTNGNCPVAADATCLKELQQGTITTMVTTGATNAPFDLLGIDFLLVGSGNNDPDDDDDDDDKKKKSKTTNQNNTSSFIITAGATVLEIKMGDALGLFPTFSLKKVDGTATGNVTFNEGYRLVFNGLFDNVTSVSFTTTASTGNAQARIDNVVVPDVAPVPVPAAGLMLLAGLGGMAALRRRKQTA